MDYESLEELYKYAKFVCDPVEYKVRQKKLLYGLCEYLLERDKPVVEKESIKNNTNPAK